MNKGSVMKFLYTIQHPCSGRIWFTCNPVEAQQASNHGCRVTCKGTGTNNKVYKHSKHLTTSGGRRV